MTNNYNNKIRAGLKYSLSNFIHDSRSVGIVLLSFTIISLVLTNIPGLGLGYHNFWENHISFFDGMNLPHTVLHFINDALMAIFFFQVGLEIKREAVVGELSSPSRITLPIVAAICGVVFPALIFSLLNNGTPFINGWAIPTATDIAFSLGVLSLLGKSIPHSLKIFLTALAIIDDLIAILVIALFYASGIILAWIIGVFATAIIIFFVIRYMKNKAGFAILLLLSFVMWYCMYQSGIHSTFAGVILAMMFPVSMIPRMEKALHIPVSFIVLPLFALANTSILISASSIDALTSTLSLGIFFGLLLGKPVGIIIAVFGLTKSRIIKLKGETGWSQFFGVGILAGIGFTMSIFVSTLAFEEKVVQDIAKLSVLIASFCAMILGYGWLKITAIRKAKIDITRTSSENEI